MIEGMAAEDVPIDPTSCTAWPHLTAHHAELAGAQLRDLFAADEQRAETLSLEVDGLLFDYSKHRVTPETISRLVELATQRGLRAHIDAMFAGEHINTTEDRAVLHTALRRPREKPLLAAGVNVVEDVHQVLDRMSAFASAVRQGNWAGHTGRPLSTVVNIGIGGSDLGPAMAYEALAAYRGKGLSCHYVSNVDGADIAQVLAALDPETALFVVASKTFTTFETLTNARSARAWLVDQLGSEPPCPVTSWPCRPTPTRSRPSASTPPTCSGSGTGWAAATPSTPPSACR